MYMVGGRHNIEYANYKYTNTVTIEYVRKTPVGSDIGYLVDVNLEYHDSRKNIRR